MLFKKKTRAKIKPIVESLVINGTSPFDYVEGYKSLRTNLNFLTFGGEVKSILVTSSIAQEGKSTIAINLARTLAMAGNYVLLVDADLRSPVIDRYIRSDHEMTHGLSSVLASKSSVEKAIYKCPNLEFEVMFSGPIPPNAVELLSRERTHNVMKELREKYDYIIIDSPSSGRVTDALVLSQYVDGVLFAIRQNFAEKDQIRKTLKNFVNMDVNILGIVFNDYVSEKKMLKKRRGNYHYQYNKEGVRHD